MKSHIIFVKCIKWWFFHHFLNFNLDTVANRRKYVHSKMATTTEKKRGHFSRKNRQQVIEFVAIPYGKKDETLFGALLQRILLRVLLLRKKVRLKYMMSNTFSSHCIKVVPFSLESILQSTNVKGMFKNPPFLPDSHIHEK